MVDTLYDQQRHITFRTFDLPSTIIHSKKQSILFHKKILLIKTSSIMVFIKTKL